MDSKHEPTTACQDSGCGSFETSDNISASTPYCQASRKRKFSRIEEVRCRKLVELESCPSTPQASSTLNESLICKIEKCKLIDKIVLDDSERAIKEPSNKFRKYEESPRGPGTPCKQIIPNEAAFHSSPNVSSYKVPFIAESPLKHTHDILYPNLRPVGVKKTLSPEKFAHNLQKSALKPVKKLPSTRAFYELVRNSIIMENVFQYLSNGDLYRLHKVSESFQKAIENDTVAYNRFISFQAKHRRDKENYKITPPSSPQKNDTPTPPVSPGSKHFYDFLNIAKSLDSTQSQMKCPRCNGPSIVTTNVAQCTNVNSCGYIYCKLCGSFSSTGPEDFVDKCGKSLILSDSKPTLNDLSNFSYNLLSSPRNRTPSHYYSSGYHSVSVNESSSVRRNLSGSFSSSSGDKSNVLSTNNRNGGVGGSAKKRLKRQSSILPVVDDLKQHVSVFDSPPSPPKVKEYVACSKMSKRSLKRLTR